MRWLHLTIVIVFIAIIVIFVFQNRELVNDVVSRFKRPARRSRSWP